MRALLLVALLALAGCSAAPPEPAGAPARGQIVRVVDGDTLRVRIAGMEETVRLLGIDTPETVKPGAPVECGGPAATRHLVRLTARARAVVVRTDPTQDERDRYDRLLAYVTPAGERTTLQERLLAAGHARVYVFERPFRRLRRFRAAERAARDARRGAWSSCAQMR